MKKLCYEICNGPFITSGANVQYWYDNKVLSFQGSVQISDWINNILFLPKVIKPYKNMKDIWFAHHGFVKMWKSISDEISSVIGETDNITISGFSQGAALAILAAEDLRFKGKNVKLITFGSPKVFWGIIPKSVKKRTIGIHYCARGDLVAHIPFSLLGYSRQGTTKKIGPMSIIGIYQHDPDYYIKYLGGLDDQRNSSESIGIR